MNSRIPKQQLNDAEIRSILEQTRQQARGGKAGAVARAGLGTLALVLAVFAATDTETVGLILLCGVFVAGLGFYIRTVARAAAVRKPIAPTTKAPTGAGNPTTTSALLERAART